MKKHSCLLFTLFIFLHLNAQENASFTLEEALSLSRKNAPILIQQSLIQQIKDHQISDLKNKHLPQLNLNAQVTYQSDVTSLDIDIPQFPIEIESLSKDQYRIQAEVMQVLYDGGTVKQLKMIQQSVAQIEAFSLETDLEKIRKQIIEIYFSILEVEEITKQLEITKSDVDTKIKRLEAAVENGVVLKIELLALQAERIKIDQKTIELSSNKSFLIQSLALLTGEQLNISTKFIQPAHPNVDLSKNLNRPVLQMLQASKNQLMLKSDLDKKMDRPKANLFARAGYGKPGFNFLKNEFDFFYIAGIRAQWNLSNLYLPKKTSEISRLQQAKLDTKEKAFRQKIDIQKQQYELEAQKLIALKEADNEIILLRQKIHKVAEAQLENGSITSADYITKLNDEALALQTKAIRDLQILKNKYLIQHTLGL